MIEKGGDNLSFYGTDFLWDNQFSQSYGLKIVSINGNSTADVDAGSSVEVFSDAVYRSPTRYYYGAAQSQVLTFEMEVASESPIIAINRSKIEKWLFGRINPCKLQIVQPDLQTVYFYGYLLDPKALYIGNHCYGFKFTMECDAPWAWQISKTYAYTDMKKPWKFYNDSDNTDYTYPLMEIQIGKTILGNGDLSIVNHNDGGREFLLKGLHANEKITVDCRLQKIISSEKRLLSEFFNKKFFRLVSGINLIQIAGDAQCVRLTYSNARKVGG